jgi:hypothetical protein
LTTGRAPRYHGEQMANRPDFTPEKPFTGRAVAGHSAQIRSFEHAELANGTYGGAGALPVRARRPATQSRAYPNPRAGVAAVRKGVTS